MCSIKRVERPASGIPEIAIILLIDKRPLLNALKRVGLVYPENSNAQTLLLKSPSSSSGFQVLKMTSTPPAVKPRGRKPVPAAWHLSWVFTAPCLAALATVIATNRFVQQYPPAAGCWPHIEIVTDPSPRSYFTANPTFFPFSWCAVAVPSRNGSSGFFCRAQNAPERHFLCMFFSFILLFPSAGKMIAWSSQYLWGDPFPFSFPLPWFRKIKKIVTLDNYSFLSDYFSNFTTSLPSEVLGALHRSIYVASFIENIALYALRKEVDSSWVH